MRSVQLLHELLKRAIELVQGYVSNTRRKSNREEVLTRHYFLRKFGLDIKVIIWCRD